MSESPPPDGLSATNVKRGIRWDALAAIIASLVGLLALVVAGYTAYIQRQQVRAQVWPYLIGANSGGRLGLFWINKGVGPAIVRSVEVTVDGKPQSDWKTVVHSIGLPAADYHQSFLSGNVLSPGENLDWIQFQNKADYDNFLRLEHGPGFQIKVCYCSTLGDCWQTGFGGVSRQSVKQCPALPESKQFTE
ncbi:MAG TPA: hypothetical protein VKV22_07055 [Rhodanobacteraceae bacterium]|nr:hypothetical protein [Rhodanobacteraceae bacterium]